MNNFAQISYNVGIRVGDTSAAFGNIINGYINQRYQRIFKKFNFPTIVPAFTITSVAGQTDYPLPQNFGHEVYVYDSTNLIDIKRKDFEELERIYANSLNQSGNVFNYTIFDSLDLNVPPNVFKTLRLYQNPTSVAVYQVPYIIKGANLVAQTDLPAIDMADLASELGATADAWRTKRQFQKASDFDAQYEQVILEMIWSIENDPNRVVQFRPTTYRHDNLYSENYYGY